MRDFRVWCPDMGQKAKDGRTLAARDFQGAAAEWGRIHDIATKKFTILKGRPEVVMVQEIGKHEYEPLRLKVFGESVPAYSARFV